MIKDEWKGMLRDGRVKVLTFNPVEVESSSSCEETQNRPRPPHAGTGLKIPLR